MRAVASEAANPAFGVPHAGCTYRKRRAVQRLSSGRSSRRRRTASGPCSYLFDGIDYPLRIKIAATNTTAYYELDLAGNVRGLRASGGASLGGYRYSAFGQTLEDTTSITQPLRWKGRWFSALAGGTYDVRARQWSPELGCFWVIDEFEFQENKTTLWGWPNQNSLRFRDPQGRGGAFETEPQCKARCGREHLSRSLAAEKICRDGCASVCSSGGG